MSENIQSTSRWATGGLSIVFRGAIWPSGRALRVTSVDLDQDGVDWLDHSRGMSERRFDWLTIIGGVSVALTLLLLLVVLAS
jgi:hypothetical protein